MCSSASGQPFSLQNPTRIFAASLMVCQRPKLPSCTHVISLGVGVAPWGRFGPSGGTFLLTVPGRCFFCGSFVFFLSCVCYAFCVRLLICALWSPAAKRLTSWLSFVVSNSEFVTFPLVSWQVWYLIVSIPDL